MMPGNYFFIDGSALAAQIRRLRKADSSFLNRKLCPRRYIMYLMQRLGELHAGAYKRATFYFPKGDEDAVAEYLLVPDLKRPGEVRDIHFKYCGEKLKKSAKFDAIVEAHIPEEFRDRVTKSEKGVDIEICCDALKLASGSKVERLFLLSNDRDFIPLCRTLKEFGANISLLHLSPVTDPGIELLREVDSYDVVPIVDLQGMFLPVPEQIPAAPQINDIVGAAKPEAAPSDMNVAEDAPAKVPAEPQDAELLVEGEVEAEVPEDAGEGN